MVLHYVGFVIVANAAVALAAGGENAYRMLQELLSILSSHSVFILPPVDTCRCRCTRYDSLSRG